MPILPGVCGDIAAKPYLLFLGTQPHLKVHERLLRQLQPVYAWYASRRRVREQAKEFVELDLTGCDAELMMRYCHVYYVRRQIYDELMSRQLTLIETGKAARMADERVLGCLSQGNVVLQTRLNAELQMLQRAKQSCVNVPHRRELRPAAPLEAHDYLCMMRLVEEDVCGVVDAEMQARTYFRQDVVHSHAERLAGLLFLPEEGTEDSRRALDKKEQKLLHRLIPCDYHRIGAVPKLRPFDVATYFAFCGAHWCARGDDSHTDLFRRALWSHVFRKYATHPSYLRDISLYWAYAPSTAMPAARQTAAQTTTTDADEGESELTEGRVPSCPDARHQGISSSSASPQHRTHLEMRDLLHPHGDVGDQTEVSLSAQSMGTLLPPHMPLSLAHAVCTPPALFPALNYRAQFMYTSVDTARQHSHLHQAIPLLRLFPTLGAEAAESMAASMVVERVWAELQVGPEESVMEERVLRAVRLAVREAVQRRERDVMTLLREVEREVERVSTLPLPCVVHGECGESDEAEVGTAEEREKGERQTMSGTVA